MIERLWRWRAVVTGALAVVCVGAVAGRAWAPAVPDGPVTLHVPDGAMPAVVGLGSLEPSSTIVRVGASGGPDAAKVGRLLVQEGQAVEAGQALAVLDSAGRQAAQVAASEQSVRLKRTLLVRQAHETQSSVASRRAMLDRARAELAAVQAEFERQRALVAGNVVSRTNFDKAQRDWLNARATVQEMEAGLLRLQATDGTATQIDVAVAGQELAAAEAELAVARATLEETVIRAPFAGQVLALRARAGERIGADGLLELGDTGRMRAVVEVYQTDVARVAVGQVVTLTAPALPGPVEGRVERVGAAVKRQSVINNDPATATDARVVEVFVALDEPTSRAVAGLSRLQVQGVFAR